MDTQTVPDPTARYTRAGTKPHKALQAILAIASVLIARPLGAADLEYGAYLASECTTCHREDGESQGIPAIIGWDEHHFVDVLKAYRDKEDRNITMRTIVRRLTDEEMAALAAYFRSIAGR